MNGHEGVRDPSSLRTTSFEIANSYRRSTVRSGDLVVSIGPSYGKTMTVPPELEGANLTQGTARIAVAPGYERAFIKWALQSDAVRSYWDAEVGGATFRALNLGPLARTPIPLFPKSEQRRIADFLDRETAQIDALVAAQRELVELLKERRAAVITLAVAQGSGIHDGADAWPKAPLRRFVRVADGLVDPLDARYSDWPLIAPDHIESGTGRLLGHVPSATEQGAISGKGLVAAGQLVYSKIRPALNKVVIAPYRALCSADMYPLVADDSRVDHRFLLYALLDSDFVRQAILASERVAMPKINRETLGSLLIPLPPLPEQTLIADYLDHETAQMDSMIAAANESIALMLERRAALISAAVTGRIDPHTGKEIKEAS